MSVVVFWSREDFQALLESCDRDDDTPYILEYMPKDGVKVEAGCGQGR